VAPIKELPIESMYYQTMDKKMFQRVVEQQQVATNITKELSINSRIVNCPYELTTKHLCYHQNKLHTP
jgi:hypothetical protein